MSTEETRGRGAAGETKEDDGGTGDEPSPGLLEVMAMTEMPDFRVNTSKSAKGLLPLFLAVGIYVGSPSYEDALAFVLAFRGVNPNVQEDKYGNTALRIVAYEGMPRFVKRLLAAQGIDVNLANKGQLFSFWSRQRGSPRVPQVAAGGQGHQSQQDVHV